MVDNIILVGIVLSLIISYGIFYIKHDDESAGHLDLVLFTLFLAIPMWIVGYLIYLALGGIHLI